MSQDTLSFRDRFNNKTVEAELNAAMSAEMTSTIHDEIAGQLAVTTYTAEASSEFDDITHEDLVELISFLEGDGSFDEDDPVYMSEGIMGNIIASLMDEGLSEKDVIAAVLDNAVENIESMVDTVDVFHLIAAHRDMPSLSDAVPFELAAQVGYSHEEYQALCDDLDDRIGDLLSTAINQSLGEHASENECI